MVKTGLKERFYFVPDESSATTAGTRDNNLLPHRTVSQPPQFFGRPGDDAEIGERSGRFLHREGDYAIAKIENMVALFREKSA